MSGDADLTQTQEPRKLLRYLRRFLVPDRLRPPGVVLGIRIIRFIYPKIRIRAQKTRLRAVYRIQIRIESQFSGFPDSDPHPAIFTTRSGAKARARSRPKTDQLRSTGCS